MSINSKKLEAANMFFTSKGLAPDEIIRRGKQRGLQSQIIEIAMVMVWESYNPDKDHDHDLVWKVWQLAQGIKSKAYLTGREQLAKKEDEIKKFKFWLYRILIPFSSGLTLAALVGWYLILFGAK